MTILEEQIICQNYHEFGAALKKEKMKAALCHRTLHHVVRTNGYHLPGGGRDQACQTLITLYTGGRNWQGLQKCYDSALDAAIISADLAICMEKCGAKIVLALATVGEHLEAVENYSQAAKIYVHVAESNYSREVALGDRLNLYGNAGLAYKRSGQFFDAEECYIHALGVSNGHGLDLNHEITTQVITNFLVLYNELNAKLPYAKAQQDKVFHGFLALLYSAGFKGDCGGISQNLGLARVCLRLEYQTQQGAKRALTLATAVLGTTITTTTPSRRIRQHFRSVISACTPAFLPLSVTHKYEGTESPRDGVEVEAAREVVDLLSVPTLPAPPLSDKVMMMRVSSAAPAGPSFIVKKAVKLLTGQHIRLSARKGKYNRKKRRSKQQQHRNNPTFELASGQISLNVVGIDFCGVV